MRRVFIIHGWGGYPEEGWFPWLKKELEKKGFKVIIPSMPNASSPKISLWVNYLLKTIGTPDKETFFVGHSIGCQAILRYLERINTEVGGCILVAGWFKITNLDKEEEIIAKPWLETKINFLKVKNKSKKFLAVFSDNDKYVPLENKKLFEENLNATVVVEHNKGHFGGSDNIKELPVVYEELINLSDK